MNCRELNAPELVKQWRKIVNPLVHMGRDARLLKDALLLYTPVQILLGMYRMRNKNITIPIFLRAPETWLEPDENWAEVELAVEISHKQPEEYMIYLDLVNEESTYAFQQSAAARIKLREWAEGVLT